MAIDYPLSSQDLPIPAGGSTSSHEGDGSPPAIASIDIRRRYIHSDIYERLVKAEDDLTGLVAYGVYQAAKRRWVANFERRTQRSPSEDEVKDYVFTYDDTALERLRDQAFELIFQVTEERLQARIEQMAPTLVNENLRQELDNLREMVKERTGFRHHIFAHVAGFFALLGLFVLVLVGANVGEPLEWVIHRIGLAK